MAKYDTEDLLDTVLDIMVNGGALNAAILAVETEKIAKSKGLTPTLAPIAADGYYRQSWSEKVLNNSPGIFYGVEDVQTLANGNAVAKTYKLFVEIVLVDSGQTNDSSSRISRYTRALEELFSANFAPAIAEGKLTISELRPMAFKLELDSSAEIKVGGISLTNVLF